MDNYKDGVVSFDRITVLGRDFVTGSYKDDLAVFNYAFDVKPFVTSNKKKKNAPEKYTYQWEGYFNMMVNSTRIRLHPVKDDHGLFEMEKKLELAREKMVAFVKECKERRKVNAKGDRYDKQWLNRPETPYSGYVHSTMYKNGSGNLAVADCHKTIHWWLEAWEDEKGKTVYDSTYDHTLKSIDDFARGLGKACKAIQELRKFFSRELEAVPS
jgi:hypothetical protein